MPIHGANLCILGVEHDDWFQLIKAQPEAGDGLHLDSKFKAKNRGDVVSLRIFKVLIGRGETDVQQQGPISITMWGWGWGESVTDQKE